MFSLSCISLYAQGWVFCFCSNWIKQTYGLFMTFFFKEMSLRVWTVLNGRDHLCHFLRKQNHMHHSKIYTLVQYLEYIPWSCVVFIENKCCPWCSVWISLLDILKVFFRRMLKFFTFSYINSPASTLYLPNKNCSIQKERKILVEKKAKDV